MLWNVLRIIRVSLNPSVWNLRTRSKNVDIVQHWQHHIFNIFTVELQNREPYLLNAPCIYKVIPRRSTAVSPTKVWGTYYVKLPNVPTFQNRFPLGGKGGRGVVVIWILYRCFQVGVVLPCKPIQPSFTRRCCHLPHWNTKTCFSRKRKMDLKQFRTRFSKYYRFRYSFSRFTANNNQFLTFVSE